MISDLKRALGSGSRPSQYLLELAWGDLDSEKLNILCKAASLPEAKIGTVTAAYHGRKVVLRGDTEYPETYTITVYDDSNMSLRKFFTKWMLTIDDPGLYKTKLTDDVAGGLGFLGSFIRDVEGFVDKIDNEIDAIKDLPNKFKDTVTNWAYGYVGLGNPNQGSMDFAAPLTIWLLDHVGNKVHGCELENAYPIEMSSIDLAADKNNEIVEFSITFAFSDYHIIK